MDLRARNALAWTCLPYLLPPLLPPPSPQAQEDFHTCSSIYEAGRDYYYEFLRGTAESVEVGDELAAFCVSSAPFQAAFSLACLCPKQSANGLLYN